jgi:hypothetical protein
MGATIVVGLVFAGILIMATKKVFSDAKNKKCNCSGSCSIKNTCSIKNLK